MKKQLILSVSCVSDYASHTPELFAITIDEDLSSRIKLLASTAKDLDVYAIEEFNHCGLWSDLCAYEAEIYNDCLDFDSVVNSLESKEATVENPMLRVTKDSFSFTAVPDNCGDDMALYTQRIELSSLDSDEPLISV